MMWAEMDYDERLAAIVKLARDGNTLTVIARVLSTSNENIWRMCIDHSVVIHGARPGHAVPDQDDEGFGGGDPHRRRYEAWSRAVNGARETLLANENAR